MSGINRRGQKVACIAHMNVWIGRTAATLAPYEGTVPKVDEVYTVDGFIESGFLLGSPTPGTVPGIALVEIVCPLTDPGMKPMGWPMAGFAPVDERETDISELRKLATPVTEPV
jgi:hypothetical protein